MGRKGRIDLPSCPLRKKLLELSRIHDYYIFLFETAGKQEADKHEWLNFGGRGL